MKVYFFIPALFMLASANAYAQIPPIKNPSGITFTSTDHTKPEVTAYEIDILKTDGTVLTTLTVAKSATTLTGTEIFAPMNVQPITFGTYTIVVRTVAGTLKSTSSVATDPWERAPGPPSKPVLK